MTGQSPNLQPGAATFLHPSLGTCVRNDRYLCIRWQANASSETKTNLLDQLGLELATVEDEPNRPMTRINQTSGISWVRSREQDLIANSTIAQLETSEIVEWVAAAYYKETEQRDDDSGERSSEALGPSNQPLFCVNPTRLYVKQAVVDALGGTEALSQFSSSVAVARQRTSRLPGLVAVTVENASLSQGQTAIEVGQQLLPTLRGQLNSLPDNGIRFENIPFWSPTCDRVSCQLPATEFLPNDPMFGTQWGLQRINAPRGWEITRGSAAITVAVIDEGVELGHPDLNLHPQSWNASTDTPDGSPTGNHGTACAGIIGAQIDNGQGVAGLANVQIMAIATATWADIDIAEGLYFAADQGAQVVSMSFGVYDFWNIWDFDLIRDALQYAHDQGLVLVAATGNEDISTSRFPGSDARTIGVGGSNRSDERKRVGDSSSEPWWGACYGDSVDVVAPCLEIPTTDRLGGNGYDPGDYFDRFNGTSSATPHVAGLAALILTVNPDLTQVEVRSIIERTCDKISPNLYPYTNVGSKPSGTWNNEVGYGRINVERALLAACAIGEDSDSDDCQGCSDHCLEDIAPACQSPKPVPWLPHDRCMYFYEARTFDPSFSDNTRLQLRITYAHCLRLLGRQQGPLLYSTTLLPGEAVSLYEYDRFRRVRSATERVSIHASFRQTVSALSQSRRSTSSSAYQESITRIREQSDASVSVGGGLAGLLGLPSGGGEFSSERETTVVSGGSIRRVSEQFSQFAVVASQALEAERSIVISNFEDNETLQTTRRTLKNDNHCFAVTYFVRRVHEVYEISTHVEAIEWRIGSQGDWRLIDDRDNLPEGIERELERILKTAPRVGAMIRNPRQLTLPTDGLLYEPELAHCSSCEPVRAAETRIHLEQERLKARKACLEAELLALQLQQNTMSSQ
jgi:subtilisin family serine protease